MNAARGKMEAARIHPTSAGQLAALRARELPPPERVAPNVWAIASPIPDGGVRYTLSYVLLSGDSSFHLLDPGWDSAENLDALRGNLRTIGVSLDGLSTIIATHHHPDHLGIAGTLRDITGAKVVLSRAERAVLTHQLGPWRRDLEAYDRVLDGWGVPAGRRAELRASFGRAPLFADIEPDLLLEDGDVLELDGHCLTALSTPGHTGGHLCFVDRERRVVYGGDHVLPQIYSGVGLGVLPGAEPLPDFLASLQLMRRYEEYEVLPGHEYRFRGLAARVDAIAAHHLRRTRTVAALGAEMGNAPVWDYAQRLRWTPSRDRLEGFYLNSALRQTEMHLNLARSGLLEVLLARHEGLAGQTLPQNIGNPDGSLIG
ncbi:MBL fold metallo-hydrolase [Arthrobacter sp. APC 3897]|uniref:MBL fold metallo-hydrolase n=1 Tax=Arthrobacter sp. APC 3897 TaxID=3035204 RepID=UPI0025B2BE27|nr:MBL fold metallo-hydrolase [Arthrobacter sp. APC 3897]MDN3481186.1 MBL fold metallo-hydrolase [Arthrobacter sp. APC 3897]